MFRRYGGWGVIALGSGFMGWATSSVNRNLEVRDAMNREPITEQQMNQMRAYVEKATDLPGGDKPSLREVLHGVPSPKGSESAREYVPWETPVRPRAERTWLELIRGVPQAQVELRAAREKAAAAAADGDK